MGFKIKNEIEDQYQSIPKLTGILPELRCIIGQNLEILTSTGGEWSWGQAKNCVNFDFQVKFDLEGQGQSTPKTIGILTKLFCMSGSNLVILAGTSDKLSRGQARDWRPHGQTQATTIPEGQNWPRVKSKHTDWTLGLKCDHQIWPWPWPWPWISMVKYGICYISTKSGPIATKQKANISIELQASNVANGFDLGHDLDIWIFKVKCDLDHLVTKVRCKDRPDSDWGDFRCQGAADSSRSICNTWLVFLCLRV